MKKTAYIFLDWFMTTNELIVDGEINTKAFLLFIDALNTFKTELGFDIKLVVLSGTSQKSAEKTFSILKNAFIKQKNTMLNGFAYEYGGFLIDRNEKVKRYYNKTTTLGDKIDELCKKYNISKNQDYQLYYNFKFSRVNQRTLNFVTECKNTFTDKDFEFFNDKYGKGLDIKNKDLNKPGFVKKFLKNKKFDLIIFGGDSAQDERMFEENKFESKYFLGFEKFVRLKTNYILSAKSNIYGIVDDINALTTHLKNKL